MGAPFSFLNLIADNRDLILTGHMTDQASSV